MKKLIISILLLLTIGFIFDNYNDIMYFIMQNIIYRDVNLIDEKNSYYKEDTFLYIDETDNFKPKTKQDIINIFYTALNDGWDQFTFYCDTSYKDCISNTESITNDSYLLSNINNFVGTYNSYKKILVNINTLGRINISFERSYNKEIISIINNKIDDIYKNIINENMSDIEKIKAVHDYIINNTVYDSEKANDVKLGIDDNLNLSNIAYGPLIEGKGICSGYTDAMALFLDKMGIINYKVASASHTWNAVYLDEKWYHLDLTWDDPVVSTGENRLEYNFFLITTSELEKINTGQHNYDKSIYLELK